MLTQNPSPLYLHNVVFNKKFKALGKGQEMIQVTFGQGACQFVMNLPQPPTVGEEVDITELSREKRLAASDARTVRVTRIIDNNCRGSHSKYWVDYESAD